MRILKQGVPTYGAHNEHFNKAAGPLVGEIFQTEDEGPIGYVTARAVREVPRDWHPSKSVRLVKKAYATPLDQSSRFDLTGLGEYERVVFSCLAWGEYATYVLAGEMGSGKSTTTKHIKKAIERPRGKTCGICKTCDPVIIALDFNQGFRGKKSDDLVRRFQKALFNKLRQHLRKLFSRNPLVDSLLEEISNERDDSYAAFDAFAQQCEEDISQWNAKSMREKANALFTFVDAEAESEEERVELIMTLVRLTKHKLRADNACLVFFFDNIDSVLPQAQYEILVEILSYMKIAQAKALVVLRRSTFQRLQNQAAFSFGVIDHLGPKVREIIQKRLKFYLENWPSFKKVQVLERVHSGAVRQRLAYIMHQAGGKYGALQQISFLAGASVRLGLFLSERMVINAAVQFNEDPHYANDLTRSVLIGTADTPGIGADDPYVANIFIGPRGTVSLLNLRILQLIAALENDISRRNVLTFLVLLRQIGNWRADDVRKALNYLLSMRRPLIWVDGKAEYESVASMHDSDDFLHLTEAGYFYLHNLSRDIVFVEEAALDLAWPDRWMPKSADYSVIVDRFRLLHGALRELLEQDLEQTMRFKSWIEKDNVEFSLPLVLITNRIIASIGGATLRILTASDNARTTEELRDWLSLINIGINHEKAVSMSVSKRLQQLSREYENLLRLMLPSSPRQQSMK